MKYLQAAVCFDSSLRARTAWVAALSLVAIFVTADVSAQDQPAAPDAAAQGSSSRGSSTRNWHSVPTNPALDIRSIRPSDGSRTDEARFRDESRPIKQQIQASRREVVNHLQGDAGEPATFKLWFNSFVFSEMTQFDDDSLSRLGEMRQEFFKVYLSNRITERGKMIQLTFAAMNAIANNNGAQGDGYHPAVRLNAIAILSMLDDRPADSGSDTLPEPNLNAFNALAQIYLSDQFTAAHRIAAFSGLHRHMLIDSHRTRRRIAPNALSNILDRCLAIVSGNGEEIPGLSEDGAYWRKRLAAQILGSTKVPGKSNGSTEIVDTLIAAVEDSSSRRMLRYDAVEGLGKIRFDGVAPAVIDRCVNALTIYLADAAQQEGRNLLDELNRLIEVNILYGDVDLEVKGNVDDSNGGGRRANNRSFGTGGGLVDGGQSNSGGDITQSQDTRPRVEIANYHINVARQKVKISAALIRDILNNRAQGSLGASAAGSSRALVDQANLLISDSEMSVIDKELEDLEEVRQNNGFYNQENPYENLPAYRSKTRRLAEKLTSLGEMIRNNVAASPPAATPGARPRARSEFDN